MEGRVWAGVSALVEKRIEERERDRRKGRRKAFCLLLTLLEDSWIVNLYLK